MFFSCHQVYFLTFEKSAHCLYILVDLFAGDSPKISIRLPLSCNDSQVSFSKEPHLLHRFISNAIFSCISLPFSMYYNTNSFNRVCFVCVSLLGSYCLSTMRLIFCKDCLQVVEKSLNPAPLSAQIISDTIRAFTSSR